MKNNSFLQSLFSSKIMILLCLLVFANNVLAVDYVITRTNNGTTYYLASNSTTGVQRVTSFDAATCIWHCYENTGATTPGELSTSNNRYLVQKIGNTNYFLTAGSEANDNWTITTTPGYSARMRITSGNLLYARISGGGSPTNSYLRLSGTPHGGDDDEANATAASVPSQSHTAPSTSDAQWVTTPSISPSTATLSEEGDLQVYTVTSSVQTTTTTYAACTKYTFGGNNYYYYNNVYYTSESAYKTAAQSVGSPVSTPVTYNWSITSNTFTSQVADGNTYTVTHSTQSATDNTYTITVTASATGVTNRTATASVTLEAPRVDPTSVSASDLTVYVGNSQPANVTLTPNPCYRNLEFTSSNTGIATVTNAGVVTGVAVGTTTVNVKAYKIGNTDYLSTTFNVTVKDKVATPVISYEPNNSNDGATATTTLTCATSGATIYYTTNGDEPTTSSTPYTTTFTVNNNQTVKAIAVKNVTGWDNSDIATLTYVKRVLPTPTIEMSNGSVTFTCTEPGVTFHYTTNGTTPTASSTAWTGPTAITGLTNECTIKVIATKSGWIKSAVASRQYIMASGASGSVVTLNDYEDHNWSYYSGAAIGNYNTKTDYKGKLYSPNPRNIKITYLGKGQMRTGNDASSLTAVPETMRVSVGLGDESENTFVYYKTLERNANNRYEYTTIPNPFQVRPTNASDGTTKWRGFQSWRIKSISGGSIYAATTGGTALAVGSMLNAETAYYFVPDDANGTGYTPNCTSMSIELEAVWARAYVNDDHDVGFERNFRIITANSNDAPTTYDHPTTYSSIYPNGCTTATGTTLATGAQYRVSSNFQAANDTKFEYIILRNTDNNSTLDARCHNLVIGRGVVGYNNGLCATQIRGYAANDMDFTLRVESGTYTNFYGLREHGTSNGTYSGICKVRSVLGCDYDRAKNDNTKLNITTKMWMGESCYFSTANNRTQGYYKCWIKSGDLMSGITVNGSEGAGGTESFYYATSGRHGTSKHIYPRYMYMEGGQVAGLAGGLDDTTVTQSSEMRVYLKMTGGFVRGCIYGAGAFFRAAGTRNYIIVGGEVGGWIAAGCNGIGDNTSNSANGRMNGNSFVYIGGNVKVGYKSTTVNGVEGGNIFGAGRGTPGKSYDVGTVNNSNIVIADNAKIEKNVYGGGNYGFTLGEANIYITGGTVDGNVFGGSNMIKGFTPSIYMTDGLVKSGIYGGCNTSGAIANSVTIQINGGQVGADAAHTGNVHGGGYGDTTGITKNVDITIGTSSATDSVTIYGDVYGGSALGSVNGTTAADTYHTNVTLNKGIIYGSLYGGGLGDASHQANVYGPVTVTINGGKLCSTTQGGLGAVFGCNNTNGRPRRKVLVNVTGGEMEYIYGGGNAAPYTVLTPNSFDNFHVWMSGGRVHKHVFGGGLGANAIITGNTEVRITGPSVIEGNVYGGGNAGTVTGNTNVQIGTN